jgi:DNA-binding FrmR family transcriptional regulator
MLEAGRDCKEIITQLAAASRALDRVGFRIVASGLKECVAGANAGSKQAEIDRDDLERLFLALA